MMGRILEHWRVCIAGLFAFVLIAGAFVLARGIETPSSAEASTESALLQAIATRDSDNDGLPDWEEALYGTSPNNPDTNHLGMTDGEAVAKGLIVPKAITDLSTATPTQTTDGSINYAAEGLTPPTEGSLTDAFAKNFFTLYMNAQQAKGGASLTQSDLSDISNQALNSLLSSVSATPDFKSANDLKVSGSGANALKAFAADAEAVFMKNGANATTSEINYLQYAVQGNDPTALLHIESISRGYRSTAVGLAVLPVPRELAAADLALVNAMARLSELTSDFTSVNSDPLVTMLALKQYPQVVQALGNAYIQIGNIYKTAGISLSAGMPGAAFVNFMRDIAAEQKAAAKP